MGLVLWYVYILVLIVLLLSQRIVRYVVVPIRHISSNDILVLAEAVRGDMFPSKYILSQMN